MATHKSLSFPQVLTSVFIFIGALSVGILGIAEKANILMITLCFIFACIYGYASVKNIRLYFSAKRRISN